MIRISIPKQMQSDRRTAITIVSFRWFAVVDVRTFKNNFYAKENKFDFIKGFSSQRFNEANVKKKQILSLFNEAYSIAKAMDDRIPF